MTVWLVSKHRRKSRDLKGRGHANREKSLAEGEDPRIFPFYRTALCMYPRLAPATREEDERNSFPRSARFIKDRARRRVLKERRYGVILALVNAFNQLCVANFSITVQSNYRLLYIQLLARSVLPNSEK